YNADGASQTKSLTVRSGKTASYDIQVQNDGSATDSFQVRGSTGNSSLSVKYSIGSTDITAAVTAGTYTINNLAAGGNQTLRFVVTATRNAPVNSSLSALITVTSLADTTKSDAVKAVTTVK